MHIFIETRVEAGPEFVFSHFNEDLFKQLNPPFPKVELLRFDGCDKGDEVHLRLNFVFFKQQWNSLVIEAGESYRGHYFIDQGIRLPFFLTYWEHKHLIRKNGQGSSIIDKIYFKSYNVFVEILIYPLMWLTFMWRKPVYRRRFQKDGL